MRKIFNFLTVHIQEIWEIKCLVSVSSEGLILKGSILTSPEERVVMRISEKKGKIGEGIIMGVLSI